MGSKAIKRRRANRVGPKALVEVPKLIRLAPRLSCRLIGPAMARMHRPATHGCRDAGTDALLAAGHAALHL